MSRAAWIRSGCLLGLLGLAAALAFVPFQTIVWDGCYVSTEYRLTFIDGNGQPVPGVVLSVLSRAGGECHLYPIDEFLPDRAPTSDADGQMVFHHAGEGLEFGGRESINLLGMRFGDTDDPQYMCVFSVGSREVHRVRYDDLQPKGEWARLAKVTRPWQNSEWPSRAYAAHHGEWSDLRLRLFDGNGDGVLDREERTAAGYISRAMERAAYDRQGRDIEFSVVERTIIVTVP